MFDIVVLVVVVVLTLLGLWKGLVRQIVGLAGVAAGYVIATKFYGPLAAKFLTGFRPATGRVISFLTIFIACIIAASIIGWIAEKLMNTADLGILNRIGGGILGAAKGYLIVSVAVVMMVSFLPLHSGVFEGSRTMKYIQPMAGIVSRFAPESISKRYEERAAKMRRFYFDGDTMRRTRDSNSGADSFSFPGRWRCGCSLARQDRHNPA
jgi:membrane protein required for colicin V production